MLTERIKPRTASWILGGALSLLTRPAAAQGPLGLCGEPATLISKVQGAGLRSPLEGEVVVIEASVSADLRAGFLEGVFLQEERDDEDDDPATSEGLFVVVPAAAPALEAGTQLRVLGRVTEWNGLTELSEVSESIVCPGLEPVAARELRLPVANDADSERFEGMLVRLAQTLTVTGNHDLGRYGSLELSSMGQLFAPTQLMAPGAAAAAQQSLNDRSRIVLDDASGAQNPSPVPYLDATGTRRVGDTVSNLIGIVDARYGSYRLQPTASPIFARAVPRPPLPPRVGGSLRVAALNVFNYFTTLDTGRSNCGPASGLDCRGANSAAELDRQRAKLVSALTAIDADVVGLFEVQNDAGASLHDLADALNQQVPTAPYAALDTGVIGSDAIKTALLYRPAKLAPAGPFALLTSAFDARFADTKNRPVLAQTFMERASQARFTLVLTHLKSKSTSCADLGDPDLDDGQGSCNRTRTAAVQALVSWLASDPTRASDADVLVLGDFNAYAKEAPIATLRAAGFVPLVEALLGPFAYSYQFNGQSGYLDHALATSSLATQVTGVEHWHIDADEPALLDYNTEWKRDDRAADTRATWPFRASDHDPLLVGLRLNSETWSLLPRIQLAEFLARVRAMLHPAPVER